MAGTSNSFERRLLVAVDTAGYGKGNDQDHFAVQAGLSAVLTDAAERAGLNRDRWARQAAGDGELAILPPDEPEPVVIDDYARQLDIRLAAHNATVSPEHRIRLRMAVHFGAAMPAENGYAGQGVVAVARMVDSPQVKEALRDVPDANLVLVLSRQIFEDVVRQRHVSFGESDFTRVRVQVKEYQDEAWVKVLGASAPRPEDGARGGRQDGDRELADPADDVQAGPSALSQHFHGEVHAPNAVFGISYGSRSGS